MSRFPTHAAAAHVDSSQGAHFSRRYLSTASSPSAAASWQFTETHSCVFFDTQTSAVITTVSSRDTRPSSGSFMIVKDLNLRQPQLSVPFWNVIPPCCRTALAETAAAFSSSCFLAPSIVNVKCTCIFRGGSTALRYIETYPLSSMPSPWGYSLTSHETPPTSKCGEFITSFVSELQPRTVHRNVRTASGVVSVMAGASANAPIPSRARPAQRRDPSARDWCAVTPPSRRPQTVSRTVQ
mmetsp:Transcript_5665/g.25564  ORF Transcript_5665/g.25564 Transcript_5665/m.25564 type:complete len:239 (-) Transcript_5665:61-777(-)